MDTTSTDNTTSSIIDENCFAEARKVVTELVNKHHMDYTVGPPANDRLAVDTLIGLIAHDKYKECTKTKER